MMFPYVPEGDYSWGDVVFIVAVIVTVTAVFVWFMSRYDD